MTNESTPKSETTIEREAQLNTVTQSAIGRGVKLYEYSTGVIYDPDTKTGWGHTPEMSGLDKQPIYVTASAWDKAKELDIPVDAWIEQVIDHELLHNVLRSRAKRELVPAFSTHPLEAIAYGQQLTERYLQYKRGRFDDKTVELMKEIHQRINNNEHRGQLEKLAKIPGPTGDVYLHILKIVDQEITIGEYYEALGITI